MLQYQNQKLAQQLDVQRTEISVLEGKCNSLRSKQASYDDTLVTINRIWNQVWVSMFYLPCSLVVVGVKCKFEDISLSFFPHIGQCMSSGFKNGNHSQDLPILHLVYCYVSVEPGLPYMPFCCHIVKLSYWPLLHNGNLGHKNVILYIFVLFFLSFFLSRFNSLGSS
jgi:hypothetical protein